MLQTLELVKGNYLTADIQLFVNISNFMLTNDITYNSLQKSIQACILVTSTSMQQKVVIVVMLIK